MSSEEGIVKLISNDGKTFEVPVSVAQLSALVTDIMKDDADSSEVPEVPLPSVRAEILTKVIEFCTHYKTEAMNEIEKPLKSPNLAEVVQKWYADFIDVDQAILFEIVIAANFLNIQPLLDLTCACVAGLIKGKTPEEIRKTFNIVNDFTPEEEAQVREENKWCEEA